MQKRNDMTCQLTSMRNYSDILLSRLTRAGVDFKITYLRLKSMLKLNNVLSIETYGNNSKVVNPKIPYKVYQCNSLARMQDKNGSNTLHVVLEDITPSADNDTFNREKIVVELNQFVNTWNPYVEPKEEIKDEVGEVHD